MFLQPAGHAAIAVEHLDDEFCGLQPWFALHEGLSRSASAITDNADLVITRENTYVNSSSCHNGLSSDQGLPSLEGRLPGPRNNWNQTRLSDPVFRQVFGWGLPNPAWSALCAPRRAWAIRFGRSDPHGGTP